MASSAPRKSLQTPQARRSMAGFGRTGVEKKLSFSANRSKNISTSAAGSKRWSAQGTITKDPRPLSNRAFQKTMIDELLEFLHDSAYPHQVNVKLLSAPTAKEFLRIFEHLYSHIDPTYEMPKKFEEEIPKLLRSLGYPYTISKSSMFTIGSPHSWPTILGALHWLVQVIQVSQHCDVGEIIFPDTFNNDGSQRLAFFTFYCKTFEEFLMGAESHEESDALVEQAIIHKAGCSESDHAALVNDLAESEAELAALEAEPDILEEAKKGQRALQEAIEQEEMKISSLEQQEKVYCQERQHLEQQLREDNCSNFQLGDPSKQEELKRKSAEVKRTLDRLNAEKERLDALNGEREIKFGKIYDKVQATVNEYNDIAREIMLDGSISTYIGNENLLLSFDHSQKDPASLTDYRSRLKPLLLKLASHVSEERFAIESKKITEQEKLGQLKAKRRELEDDLVKLKAQLTLLEKEIDAKSEVLQKEYELRSSKVTQHVRFMDVEMEKISRLVEEERRLLDIETKELEIYVAELQKADDAHALDLIQLSQAVLKQRDMIKDRVLHLNNELRGYLALCQDPSNFPTTEDCAVIRRE